MVMHQNINSVLMASSWSKILTVAAALGLSASLILFLLRKLKEEELDIRSISTSRQSTIQIRVPKLCVAAIIGKQGKNIKQLQQMTKAKINFSDEAEEQHRILTIRGLPQDVAEAEKLVLKIIEEQPTIETYEMFIPSFACGGIIGRNGDHVRFICQASKAKVLVEQGSIAINNDTLRKITIKGTLSQIDIAKNMIEEKLTDIELKYTGPKSSSNQDIKSPMSLTYDIDETQPYKRDALETERLIPTASDGFLEVFIAAVQSPSHFWVQTCGTHAKDLDKLVEDLTECYSHPNAQYVYELTQVEVGDIVAAPFRHDHSWYRARVLSVEEESYSNKEKQILVYYVDFGDSETLTLQDLCKLEKRFLNLPFQAIECSLACVSPKEGNWTEEAIKMFEQLTYVAQWKFIMAKPLTEQSVEKTAVSVQLIDTNGPNEINVADELVQHGFAIYNKE